MMDARAMPIHAELLRTGAARLRAAGIETSRLDAEVLLAHVVGTDRAGLYARLHAASSHDVEARFAALIDRRARHEPIAYITRVREFWSLPFAVTPAVLIPRPETELLVEIAVRLAVEGSSLDSPRRAGGTAPSPAVHMGGGLSEGTLSRSDGGEGAVPALGGGEVFICDIGTGSGCIAVALAHELPHARVVAVDVSTAALAVAAHNALINDVAERITFVGSDLFDALGADVQFDVIVSNPPYLNPGDRIASELTFEPRTALAGGTNGRVVIHRLIAAASARVRAGGWLVMELGCGQDAAVCALARAAGFVDVDIEPDLAGIPRALVARRTGRGG